MRSIAARLAAVATLAAVPVLAPPAHADPGRVVLPDLGGAQVRDTVDIAGSDLAAALPDGGALLIGGEVAAPESGFSVIKVDRRGAVDPSFGPGGAARVNLGTAFRVRQFLRAPDGKLILIGAGPAADRFQGSPLVVVRLNAEASLDASFGSGGVAATGVQESCAACATAVLQADGGIVLTGQTGRFSPTPAVPPDLHWVVTRLTPSGAVDQTFGRGGIATLPAAAGAVGSNVALLANGDILAEGAIEFTPHAAAQIAALTPAGALDPGFGGGAPVALPFATVTDLLVANDGAIVVSGLIPGPGTAPPFFAPARSLLARYTPAGTPDPAFGSSGAVDLGTSIAVRQLVAAAGRALLVIGVPAFPLRPGAAPAPATLEIERVTADGTVEATLGGSPSLTVGLPFGGGGSSFLVSQRPRPLPPLSQNSFVGGRLLARPDGSFLAVGGVGVTQPTGEGTGRSISRSALAALTPAFALDPAFGGPATPLRAVVHLVRQRAATAYRLRGVRVVLDVSAPGLALVKIKTRGRVIAQSLLPVFEAGRQNLPVELTAYGSAYMRRHRGVPVTLAATARDLLTTQADAAGTGTLP